MIEDLIKEYGLWAVFFGTMIEGDLTLLFAGVLAHYGLGGFSLGEALIWGTLGGFTGDSLSYLVGHTFKRQIRASHFYQRTQPRLERLCARFGIYSVFLVKYIYGLRTTSAVFWGFANMRYRRFGPLTLASCGAWVLVLVCTGYFFSGAIGLLIPQVKRVGIILLIALASTIAIAIALHLIERYVIARKVPEMEPPLLHDPTEEDGEGEGKQEAEGGTTERGSQEAVGSDKRAGGSKISTES
jgi:membrane protein DedA with SNARE-associated domain